VRRVVLSELAEQGVSHNPEIRKRVMIAPGELTGLTNFSQARFAPGQVAAGHAHADMTEVFFVVSGRGTMRVDGERFALTPGMCVAVEPGEVHEIESAADSELVLNYFGLKPVTSDR
jgi:mannose-6-phosphate isomerase-like protein (cupin superfamily)